MLAATAVAGTPAGPLASALHTAEFFVLPAVDAGLTLLALGWRSPGRRMDWDESRRVSRRAMPGAARGRACPGRRAAVIAALRVIPRRLASPSRFTSLPRPFGPVVGAAMWTSFLACVVTWAWASVGGLGAWTPPDARLAGQLSGIALWMVHLAVWCRVACTRLDRNRAAAWS